MSTEQIKPEDIKKRLIAMEVHDVVLFNNGVVDFSILRVPSGWLYTNNTAGTTTLVPLFH